MSFVYVMPLVGSSGSRHNVDTGIDIVVSRETAIVNGEPHEVNLNIAHCKRMIGANFAYIADVSESVEKQLMLVLAKRDAALDGIDDPDSEQIKKYYPRSGARVPEINEDEIDEDE